MRGDRAAISDLRQRKDLQGLNPFPGRVTPSSDVKIAAYTAKYWELVLCDPTGGAFAVTIPTAKGHDTKIIGVKNDSASLNFITLTATGAETIDGAATYVMNVGRLCIWLCSNGDKWLIV